jgi:hypothetical protein
VRELTDLSIKILHSFQIILKEAGQLWFLPNKKKIINFAVTITEGHDFSARVTYYFC